MMLDPTFFGIRPYCRLDQVECLPGTVVIQISKLSIELTPLSVLMCGVLILDFALCRIMFST